MQQFKNSVQMILNTNLGQYKNIFLSVLSFSLGPDPEFNVYFDSERHATKFPFLKVVSKGGQIWVYPTSNNPEITHKLGGEERIHITEDIQLINIIDSIIELKTRRLDTLRDSVKYLEKTLTISVEDIVEDVNGRYFKIRFSINPVFIAYIRESSPDMMLPYMCSLYNESTNKALPGSRNRMCFVGIEQLTVKIRMVNVTLKKIMNGQINDPVTKEITEEVTKEVTKEVTEEPEKEVVEKKPSIDPHIFMDHINKVRRTRYRIVSSEDKKVETALSHAGYLKIMYAHDSYCFTTSTPISPTDVKRQLSSHGVFLLIHSE
jgi:hypothetical protein